MKVKSYNKGFPQKMDLDSRHQSSQAEPAPEEEVPSLGFPKAVVQVSGKGLKEIKGRHTIKALGHPNKRCLALEAKSFNDCAHLLRTYHVP